MTRLRKTVCRATDRNYNVLRCGVRHARPIVVRLMPGDLLKFSELRGRNAWVLPIDTAFKYAVRLQAFQDAAEKRRKKKGV